MGMQVGKTEGIRAEINVVPLIDIVLVVLIIFMVITPMLQKGIAVQLPEGLDPAKKPDSKEDVIVSIKDDESLWVTGEEEHAMTKDSLEAKLREIAERSPSTPLFIKADRRLRYGIVKETMLLCESAGFRSVSLVAEAPK